MPFPFYLLSFSTPHLPSPNLKPIQYLRCSNSAGETTPPCQQVPRCPLTAGLQSSLANHLCVPSEYSLPSLTKASHNHRETVHLSFTFPAAPPSYFLYVRGIPAKLGWTLIQHQIFELALSDSFLGFDPWKFAPGTVSRHREICKGEQGERYNAKWEKSEIVWGELQRQNLQLKPWTGTRRKEEYRFFQWDKQ